MKFAMKRMKDEVPRRRDVGRRVLCMLYRE
jgi:hypothetical protein